MKAIVKMLPPEKAGFGLRYEYILIKKSSGVTECAWLDTATQTIRGTWYSNEKLAMQSLFNEFNNEDLISISFEAGGKI